MIYDPENAKVLLDLFRHKLVHLAQPNPVIQSGPDRITWKYHHYNKLSHLKKLALHSGNVVEVSSNWTVRVTHEFNIITMDLIRDIKDSTTRHNGYLDMLEKIQHL
jgi:hypothetical protein